MKKSTRIDDVLGVFLFDELWERKEKIMLFGQEYSIDLFIQAEKDEEFTNIQKEAYIQFRNKLNILEQGIVEIIYSYYQDVVEEYRDMYEEMADEKAPILSNCNQIISLIRPESILVKNDNERDVIILFHTTWDSELGFAVEYINEKIEEYGIQSEIL